ncbi:hypothetical protein ARAM_004946 [Aspergillus rambellii]|uniref:Uncharacterized protein n=1 Tax=Aspergillus rambellii TaxID=308745 RepID=A0A0F8V9Y3_9EURO|nr:hypothetical protein ARAM_004946 [Aspergillus rambellii]
MHRQPLPIRTPRRNRPPNQVALANLRIRVRERDPAGGALRGEAANSRRAGGKDDDGVFGVLYEMDAADEEILDGYEGVDTCSAGSGSGSGAPREVLRPREQGDGCYNKWFVRAKVVTWLDGGYRVRNGLPGEGGEVKVLVYVDEERVEMGSPKDEYVPRMNRAIREAVELGFPGDWAEEVMRPFIPLN